MNYLWTLWEGLKPGLALLSAVGISVSAVAAAAYAIFKFLGERWINHKLSERLEAYRSEQARELEKLRHKINGVFDRTKRLHDREFEVLPEVWSKLVEAESWAQGYLSGFRQYPDIGRMNNGELEEFLEGTRFSQAQKRTIGAASDRQTTYNRIAEMYRYYDAYEKMREASILLSKHGIFVLGPLREDMKILLDLIHTALIEEQINQEQSLVPKMKDSWKKFKNEGAPLFKKIEEGVIKRLWDSATAEL